MPRVQHVCIACSSQIQQPHTAFRCEGCNRRQHLKCGTGISQSFYWMVTKSLGVFEWYCAECSSPTMARAEHTCIACSSQIQQPHTALRCEECNRRQHLKCGTGISQDFYWKVVRCLGVFEWSCSACSTSTQSEVGNETSQISPQPKRRCSCLDGDGIHIIPAKRQRTDPVSSQSTAPVSSQPVAPVTSHPTAPVFSQSAAPVPSQPSTPVSSRSAAPVPSQPSTPVSSRSTALLSRQPAAPVSSQPAVPVSNQSTAPVPSWPAAPVSSQPAAQVSNRSTAPVSSRPAAPVPSQPSTPVSSRSTALIFRQPAAPVSSRPAAPVSNQSTAPVPSRPAAPVSSRSAAPAHVRLTRASPKPASYAVPDSSESDSTESDSSDSDSAGADSDRNLDNSAADLPTEKHPKNPVTYEILEKGSCRGNPLLVSSEGYDFRLQNNGGLIKRWVCNKVSCSAVMNQRGNFYQPSQREHTHPPQPYIKLKRQMVAEAKEMALSDTNRSADSIVKEICSRAPKEVLDVLPIYNLKQIVYGTRNRIKPRI